MVSDPSRAGGPGAAWGGCVALGVFPGAGTVRQGFAVYLSNSKRICH